MLNILTKSFFTTIKVPVEALKKLREQTGAPINQCKKALEQSNLVHDMALKWLQQKGLLSADKMLGKETREGVIGCIVSQNRKKAVMIQVNCQTDFVAKNDLFVNFVKKLQQRILQSKENLKIDNQAAEQINKFLQKNEPCDIFPQEKSNKNMLEQFKLVIARLQQNIRIRRVITLHSDKGSFGYYVHRTYAPGIGLQSSLVQLHLNSPIQTESAQETFKQFSDNIATQILGSHPKYLSLEEIPQQVIQQQTQKVKTEMAKSLEKAPEAMRQKIIFGKMNSTFYSQFLLPSMNYILSNDGESVGDYWATIQKTIDRKINITNYVKWQCK